MENYDTSARDNLRIIFKRKPLLLLFAVLSVVFTTISLSLIMPKYKSEVRLLVSGLPQVESRYYTAIPAFRPVDVASTISEVIKSRNLLREVVLTLGMENRMDEKKFSSTLREFVKGVNNYIVIPVMSLFKKSAVKPPKLEIAINRLAKNIRVESIERTDVIRVIAFDYNPVVAAEAADALAKRYIAFNMEQQLSDYRTKYGEKHPKIYQLENELKDVKMRIAGNNIGFDDVMNRGNVKVIEQASIPISAATPNKKMAYIVSLFLFILLGIVGMFVMETLDHSLKTPAEIERYLNLQALASIPSIKARAAGDTDPDMDGPYYRPYELFAGRLQLLVKERHPVCIAVTSAEHKEGKSVTAKDISVLLSKRAHIKTLLIDANTKSPSADKLFGFPPNPGLNDVIDGSIGLEKAKNTANDNLDVITAGKAGPKAILKTDKLRRVIDEAKKRYDLIIFDTSSVKSSAASFLICKQADLVLMVIKESSTRREVVKDVLRKMNSEKITFLGAVLTNQRHFIPAFIYKHV